VLNSRGQNTWTYSYIPGIGTFCGITVRHEETITMAELLTQRDEQGHLLYRPTVYFCYKPISAAIDSLKELETNNFVIQKKVSIVDQEIVSGGDNLGCFLLGHDFKGWWIGSLLSIESTRALVPQTNATSLQVAISLAAAIRWMIQNPKQGIHFPESLPTHEILESCKPYLGEWISQPVNWTRQLQPEENIWQFSNFLQK